MGVYATRRQVGVAAAMGAAAMCLPGSAVAWTDEDRYWESQWLIGELEQDAADMRNHFAALRAQPA